MSQDHGLDASSVDLGGDDPTERLRQLEAFTDATLAHLDLEQLLNELLARARQFLRADTAAVLMLDRDSQQLVATVAHGIEEEVRQGVRIPLGTGFAGRVAAAKEPVAISHVDATTVFNPILINKGIRAMLGVPLLASGEVLGVLHVGTLAPRHFTEHDSRLLQLVADRAAMALQARLSERSGRPRGCCRANSFPRRSRGSRVCSWLPGTCPVTKERSAATGTTPSLSRPAGCASWSATSWDTASKPLTPWGGCAPHFVPTRWRPRTRRTCSPNWTSR
ncbi:GAF domain-containing protein [Pseudonocardia spinosispora]|uniref:GAF domain-containing protein n=1 Tax=Pseudonocardia spinosispora TaxID=103441 RepID=UPI001FE0E2A1|nr:GAF domain-containing protein [Pseudonocardia spinosispora]